MVSISLALLMACDSGPKELTAAEKAEMMTRYTEALTDEDVTGCLTLTPELAAECAVGIAQKQVQEGRVEAAAATCSAMPEGQGRDECAFQVVDTARLSGNQAVTLCAAAGQFQNDCINHAASREVEERILRYAGSGHEKVILQQVYATLRKYTDDHQAWVMAQDMVARWLDRRWEQGTPLSRDVCGSIGPEVCSKVYQLRVIGPGGVIDRSAAWRSSCSQPLNEQVAQSHGLPTWSPEMGPTVSSAWVLMCSM